MLMDPDKAIPKDTLLEILENASWAPNHGKTEPWSFKVYTGEGRHKFATLQSDLYKKLCPTDKFKENKWTQLKERPLETPCSIVLAMEKSNSKIPEVEEIEAVACAVQNMMLSAMSFGIGSYWGSGGITYFTDAPKELGFSDSCKMLGVLYLGYLREGQEWPTAVRKPILDKVEWVKY